MQISTLCDLWEKEQDVQGCSRSNQRRKSRVLSWLPLGISVPEDALLVIATPTTSGQQKDRNLHTCTHTIEEPFRVLQSQSK